VFTRAPVVALALIGLSPVSFRNAAKIQIVCGMNLLPDVEGARCSPKCNFVQERSLVRNLVGYKGVVNYTSSVENDTSFTVIDKRDAIQFLSAHATSEFYRGIALRTREFLTWKKHITYTRMRLVAANSAFTPVRDDRAYLFQSSRIVHFPSNKPTFESDIHRGTIPSIFETELQGIARTEFIQNEGGIGLFDDRFYPSSVAGDQCLFGDFSGCKRGFGSGLGVSDGKPHVGGLLVSQPLHGVDGLLQSASLKAEHEGLNDQHAKRADGYGERRFVEETLVQSAAALLIGALTIIFGMERFDVRRRARGAAVVGVGLALMVGGAWRLLSGVLG